MDKGKNTAQVMRFMKLIHLTAMLGLFVLCWWLFYTEYLGYKVLAKSSIMVYGMYTMFSVLLFRTYNAYDIALTEKAELVYSQCLSNVVAIGMTYVVTVISWREFLNPLPFVLLLCVQGVVNYAWTRVAAGQYQRCYVPLRTVVLCRSESDLRKLKGISGFAEKFVVEQQIIVTDDDIHAILRQLEGYEAVFVLGIPATLRNGIVKYCIENQVQGYITPHVGDVIMKGATHMQMFSVPIVHVERKRPDPEYLLIKRAFDIFASLLGIVITCPFMLAVAIAIKLQDGGPVLYKQVRLTLNGREFEILKFRSMRVNAEKDGVARLASENDDRITPVGKFIRACRLDELPQLFNILRGDMTIVGPRPERPEIAKQYEAHMPAFSLRLQVKAGLTGLAQVYGRYNTEPYEKLQMDLMYINNMSVIEDLKLMFATIKILFMKESTEGIGNGQVTAAFEEHKNDDKESA